MADEPQAKRGRPQYSPRPEHRQLVQVLRSVRASHETIARKLGIDRTTLAKHFREELDHGEEDTVLLMGSAVVKAGAGGNVGAARYYLETHGGPEWRTTENRNVAFVPNENGQIAAPVLVIQPVMPAEKLNGHAYAKPNGHADPACVPLPDDATDATA